MPYERTQSGAVVFAVDGIACQQPRVSGVKPRRAQRDDDAPVGQLIAPGNFQIVGVQQARSQIAEKAQQQNQRRERRQNGQQTLAPQPFQRALGLKIGVAAVFLEFQLAL